MKKFLFSALLAALTFGCSSSDDDHHNTCADTIYGMQTGTVPGSPTVYTITHGASASTTTPDDVSQTTYNFYLNKPVVLGETCWEGDQN